MSRTIITTLFSFLAAIIVAQQPMLEFKELKHDFGTIAEDGGKVSHTFEFTNTGATPLVISNVRASCGCTTPNWTKEPVEPGQKGIVTATYNPMGRPGGFNKTITVTSNASNETVRLTISGNVTPKQNKVVEKYAIKVGTIGLKSKALAMGNINYGDSRENSLIIGNIGSEDITVDIVFDDKAVHTQGAITLAKDADGSIKVIFDSEHAKIWGPFTYYGHLSINGKVMDSDDYKIIITGNVVEDFSKMSEQDKRNAPICEIANTTCDLGVIKKGAVKVVKFGIKNQGAKAPLLIRRLINYTSDITTKVTKSSIAPGKTAYVNVTIDTRNMAVKSHKRQLTLITNDPNRSDRRLTVTWTVEE